MPRFLLRYALPFFAFMAACSDSSTEPTRDASSPGPVNPQGGVIAEASAESETGPGAEAGAGAQDVAIQGHVFSVTIPDSGATVEGQWFDSGEVLITKAAHKLLLVVDVQSTSANAGFLAGDTVAKRCEDLAQTPPDLAKDMLPLEYGTFSLRVSYAPTSKEFRDLVAAELSKLRGPSDIRIVFQPTYDEATTAIVFAQNAFSKAGALDTKNQDVLSRALKSLPGSFASTAIMNIALACDVTLARVALGLHLRGRGSAIDTEIEMAPPQ